MSAIADRPKTNVALNGFTNVTVPEVGLSNEDANLAFAVNEDGNLGCTHVAEEGDPEALVLPVRIGDRYRAKIDLGKVDFFKVDVESHEPEAFEGLRETIAKHRPIIGFEHHGQDSPPGHFERIAPAMPGYLFAEPTYAPAGSMFGKLKWHLFDADGLRLARFTTPEPRTHENIFAFPDEATLVVFAETKIA